MISNSCQKSIAGCLIFKIISLHTELGVAKLAMALTLENTVN
jgi:hypothetical protein